MLNFILGLIAGIILFLIILGVLVYRYYIKNKRYISDLKTIFKDTDDFSFEDSDFED